MGTFTKAANGTAPDYLANLARLAPYPARVGQKIIDEACLKERPYLSPKVLQKVIKEARGAS